jgi:hypothetical protein
MSTQTLAKPREAAPQEAPRASIMESPAHLYPARVRLTAKLSELQKALEDLEDYKSRAELAGLEATRAMEDSALSETEAAEKIQTQQLARNVYQARQAQREKAISALSAELKTAIGQASMELQGLVNQETARRVEIIGMRILTALDPRDEPGLKPALSKLLDYSLPIVRIRSLAPSPVVLNTHEYLVQAARDNLNKFAHVLAASEEKI